MLLLKIDWSGVGVQAGQLLLALSILIILHEFGHYITARWFGCRVEKFFLFFDPWFALVKKKVGDTVYGIGWLPLGGYVKISGMIDESMDKEAMKQPAKPYEFRSKPAWQRLIIMLGGIIVNVLVAFIIYAFVLMIWGERRTPMSSLQHGIWINDSLMYDIGLRNGDQIKAINGKPVTYFERLGGDVIMGQDIDLVRDGKEVHIDLPVRMIGMLVEKKKKRRVLFQQRVPAIAGAFDEKDSSFARAAGIQHLDRVLAVDSVPVSYYDELYPLVQAKAGKQIDLTVLRGQDTLQLTSKVSEAGTIGIRFLTDAEYQSMGVYRTDINKYGFFAAFPAAIRKTGATLQNYIDQFRLILNPDTEGYKAIGGFKAIGSVFPTTWDWESFWNITAFLSIILAFMNLLPIPALDGGHVMFTLYEMISGRKPNEKFLEYAQTAGMILLLLLMLYANGNDWFGWGK